MSASDFTLLVSMVVKHNNVLLNLITGCLYWLTAILTNSNHQHNGMEGTKNQTLRSRSVSVYSHIS